MCGILALGGVLQAADPPAGTKPAAETKPAAATKPAGQIPAPLRSGLGSQPAVTSAPAGPVSYFKQVWPVVQRSCQGCHQPAKQGGKLVLTSYDAFKAGGDEGPGFVAGKPDDSLVVQYLTGKQEPRMPKGQDPLPAEQIELFRRWIAEGAADDTPAGAKQQTYTMDSPPTYEEPPVISALAYSPDGKFLAVSGYHEVLLHKSDGSSDPSGPVRLVGLSQRINSITFTQITGETPVPQLLLVAAGGSPGRFGEIQLWELEAKKLRRSIVVGYDSVYGVSVSPDGKKLAVGCPDNTARTFELDTGKELLVLKHHTDWVFGTTFSVDNKFLVTVSRDMASKLSEADTGSLVDDVSKIKGPLKCVVRHPKMDQYLTAGDEGIPKIYKMHRTQTRGVNDLDTNLLREFEKQPGPTFSVAFSPDGQRIAAGSFGGEARVYNVADTMRVALLGGHNGSVFAVAFSADGKQLATGGFDGQVRLFDIAGQKLVKAFVPVPVKEKKVAAR